LFFFSKIKFFLAEKGKRKCIRLVPADVDGEFTLVGSRRSALNRRAEEGRRRRGTQLGRRDLWGSFALGGGGVVVVVVVKKKKINKIK
jgi:hypothetical protein